MQEQSAANAAERNLKKVQANLSNLEADLLKTNEAIAQATVEVEEMTDEAGAIVDRKHTATVGHYGIW